MEICYERKKNEKRHEVIFGKSEKQKKNKTSWSEKKKKSKRE